MKACYEYGIKCASIACDIKQVHLFNLLETHVTYILYFMIELCKTFHFC